MQPEKIVLIDDEKLVRITTAMLLKHHGFEVITAVNGEEGLTAIQKHSPGTILLDIMMPGMNGWEVLRTIRKGEQTKALFVIIFTASDLPVPEDITADGKSVTVLKKPFHLQHLLSIIRKKESGGE